MTTKELIIQNIPVQQYQGKIKRFEIVELNIPAASLGRVSFLDQPQLRNQANQIIIITNIEIFITTAYSNSQQTNSIAGFAAADLPKGVFVAYVDGEESIHQIPLAKLNHIQDAVPNPFQKELQGFDFLSNLDWDKSYVQFSAATANNVQVLPFGVTYLRFGVDPTDRNKWIEK